MDRQILPALGGRFAARERAPRRQLLVHLKLT
jgi:hypothetical protein